VQFHGKCTNMATSRRYAGKLFSILAFVLCSFMVNAQTWPPPAGMQGDGSMGNPWQIRSAEHLADLANFVNASSVNANATKGKHYRIMNDIDLTDFLKAQSHSRGWQPIGVGLDIFANQRRAFQGYMHGGGHVISGLWIHRYCENANHFEHFFNGLFGIIENATIDSLGVEVAEGDSIVGANYTGILVGFGYLCKPTTCVSRLYARRRTRNFRFVDSQIL